MARIIGIDVPDRKKIAYSLRYIYGIGPTIAAEVLEAAEIDPDRRTRELSEQELSRIAQAITDGQYIIEGDLRREIATNLKRLQSIRCYRGFRHYRGLPVRGQRTSTNARTRKGARKTVGAKKSKK